MVVIHLELLLEDVLKGESSQRHAVGLGPMRVACQSLRAQGQACSLLCGMGVHSEDARPPEEAAAVTAGRLST